MRDLPRLHDVRLVLAPPGHADGGLIGWVRTRYGDLELDGLVLRRNRDGRVFLAWPRRRDRQGLSHEIVRPLTRDRRAELDQQIIEALGLGDGGAP